MSDSLAAYLRTLDDDALTALLRRRPDLVVPLPGDFDALAARAQTRHSIGRALDGLDARTLRVLDAARLARGEQGTTGVPELRGGAPAAAVTESLAALRALALVYGPDEALRIADGVDEVCGPYPAGLGRPGTQLGAAVGALCADPARLRRVLLTAEPAARAILDRLALGPPVGTVGAVGAGAGGDGADDQPERRSSGRRGRGLAGPEPGSPVAWLVDHDLLAPISSPGGGPPSNPLRYETVELPREVGLLLRRESGALDSLPEPPPPATTSREISHVDAAGAGQALELVRQAEALLNALAAEPVPLLRTGGVGVGGLRRLARDVGVSEPTAALVLETVRAAGLCVEAEPPAGGVLSPTTRYDTWRVAALARRWADLVEAWWLMPRQPGLIGSRDERDKPVNALADEAERSGTPALRRTVLTALALLPVGAAPTADELLAVAAWYWPRRVAGKEPVCREILAEVAALGLTARDALTTYARPLLDEAPPAEDDPLGVNDDVPAGLPPLARAIDPHMPAPVDHLLVQADLTLVVPGPPEPVLAAELELAAEHESGGAASVYRITEASVRRALDAGYATDDLHTLFRRRSRTPVPQSLTYLIDDVGRRHGGLRVGTAGAYVRSDDEALLAQVLADKRLGVLRLRRLAPTVLVAALPTARMLSTLRDAGYAPVPEDAAGAMMISGPRTRRAAPAPPRRHAFHQAAALTGPRLAGIVEHVRAGEARARTRRRTPPEIRAAQGHTDHDLVALQSHSEAIAVLQQAVRDEVLVWVGYVDPHGATVSRLVQPVSLAAGYLRAEDSRSQSVHTFALHRITAAVRDTT